MELRQAGTWLTSWPTKFIVGNAGRDSSPLQYLHLAWTYGAVFSLKVFRRTIVVLSSAASVKAILDKEGLITGIRPIQLYGPATERDHLVLADMDNLAWRMGRKAINILLNDDAIETHWFTQQMEISQFLNDILDSPEKLYNHVKRTIFSMMTMLIYGKHLPAYEDGRADALFVIYEQMRQAVYTSAHPLVDRFPFLGYIHAWCTSWKKEYDDMGVKRKEIFSGLFDECQQTLEDGCQHSHGMCYLENVSQNSGGLGMTVDDVRQANGRSTDGYGG